MSFSHVTGPTVLANGRPIDGKKSLLFDANLYLSTQGEAAVAALRYFNEENRSFDAPAVYEIRASVSKMPEKGIQLSNGEKLEDTEYDVIGDITWLHPVNAEDAKQRPYVDAIGTAENINREDSTFDVTAPQWTQLLRRQEPLPIRAVIPDRARYKVQGDKMKKPIPNPNATVHISGFMTRVLPREGDVEERADRFYVAVDDVTFLGRGSSNNQLPEAATQVRTQKGKRKCVWNYDANKPSGDTGTTDHGPEENPPPTKKPKQDESNVASSSHGTRNSARK
ncbi:hypothetical protein K435DRAFT_861687 [Dendrothele bispora CBS 962.96]|uniref:Uncharacterized protein n=1 Tax=Dendrothele bispora (strain CBS 962.96) TaxID=1314807 RepID=A0A4S8LUH0_DENBC|nr:hypothetical protein K435DRAFT_861687 [Dendrothele bispora CBS 962.96]